MQGLTQLCEEFVMTIAVLTVLCVLPTVCSTFILITASIKKKKKMMMLSLLDAFVFNILS